MEYLRAYRDLDAGDDLVFVASTPGVKSDGLAIDQDRWDLRRYERNPVFLWAHDYSGMPVGRAEAWVEAGALRARVTKWATTDFARQVEQAYRDGILSAVSVGWEDVDEDGKPIRRGQTAARHVLLDVSAVPVPGDPDALLDSRRRAWTAWGHELLRMATDTAEDVTQPTPDESEDAMDEEPTGEHGEDAWAETAAAMVEVFDRESDEPDDARQKRYRALLPKYRRQGVQPPEFLTAVELRALGDAEWADVFLAGELDAAAFTGVRVGAVLNARNKTMLREAVERIESVLKSADGKLDTADKDTADKTAEPRSAPEPDDATPDVSNPDTPPGEGEPTPLPDDPLGALRSMRALFADTTASTEGHDG
jgi:hypothetical protein